jgi:hypothetical protein
MEMLIITLWFEEKRHFFRRKAAKMAPKHNIDPGCKSDEK